ncbi:hypothetical protein GCM10010289_82350 [Streptomyces violascens]|uniref:Uncharacterized protein n=1 Tax=Streptomyces violascens TaxID=67381 RepID=A0ABQ3QQV6_9ACTN|nr:hypothetical protein GCM10010289_82350 [Streptomyces violascens]GHI39661.1 hypothetical protein Sviol_40690 [Streptomyces violascens]
MRNSIARAFVACLRLILTVLLPAEGKHRTTTVEPVAAPVEPVAAPPLPRSPYATANASGALLRGEDVELIRPYMIAFERQRRERTEALQRQRRAILSLALDGIDVGPDVIHGRRLPAPA